MKTQCWRSLWSRGWPAAVMVAALTVLAGRAGAQERPAQAPPVQASALDHAAALVRSHSFARAAAELRRLLSADPSNRAAREMLAFALESMGNLEEERQVRSSLAADYPSDGHIQADYGRVLERSGEDIEALRVYRRARALRAADPAPELDAAIERMKGRTALEIGAPVAVMSDPDARSSSVEAGAAIPLGSRDHVALLAARETAEARTHPGATTAADILALSMVARTEAGASVAAGPRLHLVSRPGSAATDAGAGGELSARAPLGRWFETGGGAEIDAPWDEAAISVLRGGRTTAAEGHVYAHAFSRRLLLQAGARRRGLSILTADARSTRRVEAWQTLWIGGADLVVWRSASAVRGEMLDDALIAPTTLSSAATLTYRHYDVTSQSTPEFDALIALAPRASVDEIAARSTLASRGGRVGLDLSAGLAHDSARAGRAWRVGGALIWAPYPSTRLEAGYDEATEIASGLVGQRRTGRLSFHVDL